MRSRVGEPKARLFASATWRATLLTMSDIPATVSIGTDDPGEKVAVMRVGSERVILPLSMTKLRGEQLQCVVDLQEVVADLMGLQEFLNGAVYQARFAGLSWSAIGWSVGTTGEAARQRWREID